MGKNIGGWRLAVIMMAGLMLFLGAAGICHRMLQSEKVYSHVSGIVKTYEKVTHEGGAWEAVRVEKPFMHPSDAKMLAWDASHYDEIRQYLYDTDHSWVGNFAFYPLFPLLWRMTGLGPMGIAGLNWLLFVAGMVFLVLVFGQKVPWWTYLLLLCMPYMVIYMIPYSEALFFVCVAIGIYGLAKKHYWVYFIGFMLASATRAAGNIMAVAWVIVDVLAVMYEKGKVKDMLANMAKHLAPIAAGVLAVMIFQHMRGAEHWFEYAIAQREWGKGLSWPTWPLSDWSTEGESVTKPLLFMLFVPSLVWLAFMLWGALHQRWTQRVDDMWRLRLLSVLFFVGNIVLALFTQHGCMYSQARLLTCTPFFAFLVLDMAQADKSRAWQWGLLAAMVFAAVMCIKMFSRMDMLGCWIVLLLAVLVFFGREMMPWVRYSLIGLTVAVNVYWTAYMFNCFLTGGWIFT